MKNLQYNIDKNKIKIIVPQRLEPIQKQPKLLLDACCLIEDKDKSKIEIIYTGLDKQYEKFGDSLRKQANENNIEIKFIRFDYMSEVYKIAEDNSNNYIFKNNKDELKIKILEIIKNERYEKKEIPSDEWQKQYNINTFTKSYLNITK